MKEVLTETMKAELLQFPRKTKTTHATGSPILVGFSDGALQAYDAIVYDRWELEKPDDLKKFVQLKSLIFQPREKMEN